MFLRLSGSEFWDQFGRFIHIRHGAIINVDNLCPGDIHITLITTLSVHFQHIHACPEGLLSRKFTFLEFLYASYIAIWFMYKIFLNSP